jgi:hypothetical protein
MAAIFDRHALASRRFFEHRLHFGFVVGLPFGEWDRPVSQPQSATVPARSCRIDALVGH